MIEIKFVLKNGKKKLFSLFSVKNLRYQAANFINGISMKNRNKLLSIPKYCILLRCQTTIRKIKISLFSS